MLKTISRLVCSLITLSGLAYGAPRNSLTYVDQLGPATSASNVSITAPTGVGVRNCLTHVAVISASTYTFRMLDGGATTYSILLGAGQGYVADFPPTDPFCSSPTNTLRVTVDNGTFSINYKGYTY